MPAPGTTQPAVDTTPVRTRAESLAVLDRNRDGYVSAEEMNGNPQARTLITACDTDRDGKIASYEYARCVQAQQQQQ